MFVLVLKDVELQERQNTHLKAEIESLIIRSKIAPVCNTSCWAISRAEHHPKIRI